MRVLRTIAETRNVVEQARREGKRVGLVPTMGALHAGHLSLMRAARSTCKVVLASIFVNPLQFGPNEDLARYPRPFERDCQLLESEGIDVLFAPSVEEMYPPGALTLVEVRGMSERLCGRSRPGHFRGVTTVVSKLFHIAPADVAFFGQKDAAQVAIIRHMVRDLDIPIQISVEPIVREQDGLALSSRNAYLDPQQRKSAAVLYRALTRVQTLADQGERDASNLLESARGVVAEEPSVRLDYVEAVDPDTLEPISDVSQGALVAIAAYLGSTRLIDNVVLFGTGQARGPQTSPQ
jgi:pantoate--beta-alanine ligase